MIFNETLSILLILLGSFLTTYLILPRIIGVVKYKRLMDNPNKRSSHKEQTPSLGGVAFFFAFGIGFYFIKQWDRFDIAMSILPGLVILFIIGLKDDLVVISPIKKLIAQMIAIGFVLIHPAFHIHHLNDFFGFREVSVFVTIPLAAFVAMFIINAYNLIDGIDGLAAMVGIIIFSVYGLLFFLLGLYFFLGISAIGIGSLAAFLRFNLSRKKKIFMGDTGSLILGFIIAVVTIRIFSLDPIYLKKLPFQLENLPIIVVAILIVPVFDTMRVFTVRILNKKTPFSADRKHIHHLLIDTFQLSHRRASFVISVVNVLFILMFIAMGINLDNVLMFMLLITVVCIFVYMFYRINFKRNKIESEECLKENTCEDTDIVDSNT